MDGVPAPEYEPAFIVRTILISLRVRTAPVVVSRLPPMLTSLDGTEP